MKSLAEIDVSGKNVLVRVDFNVPLDSAQQITDDTRIRFALLTLNLLIERGARIAVASHLGRPKGQNTPELSLAPAAERLGKLLERPVEMADDCVGAAISGKVRQMAAGDVLLLENLRFHAGEDDNDDEFARKLAAPFDVYINDAFAVSHRKNASVEAITRHIPVCASGQLLEKELKAFDDAMGNPVRPLATIVGGAKVSSKLAALYNMLEKVDKLLIGGAMANTFLKARHIDVGNSKIEEDLIGDAEKIITTARRKKISLYLPVDVVAADSLETDAFFRYVPVEEIPAGKQAVDIGPASVRLFSEALYDARTILWNGPMGIFETAPFARGTQGIARAVAEAHAFTVVGGGDTVSAVHATGTADSMSYISTGGGAFLTLMEGKALPAVAALDAKG